MCCDLMVYVATSQEYPPTTAFSGDTARSYIEASNAPPLPTPRSADGTYVNDSSRSSTGISSVCTNVRRKTLPSSFAASWRSEEHTSELQSLMRISYAVFCLQKQKKHIT